MSSPAKTHTQKHTQTQTQTQTQTHTLRPGMPAALPGIHTAGITGYHHSWRDPCNGAVTQRRSRNTPSHCKSRGTDHLICSECSSPSFANKRIKVFTCGNSLPWAVWYQYSSTGCLTSGVTFDSYVNREMEGILAVAT